MNKLTNWMNRLVPSCAVLVFATLLCSTQAAFGADKAACTLPSVPAASPEQTAWQIFAAINCTDASGKLAWETWTEQTCLLDPTTKGCAEGGNHAHTLHGSVLEKSKLLLTTPLAAPAKGKLATHGDPANRLGNDCNAMTTTGPFAPANLASSPQFCEEVYVNQAELSYINAPSGTPNPNLRTHNGQAAYINTKAAIQFPTDAVELKIDWLPVTSLAAVEGQPAFSCKNKPKNVYVEEIEGVCYALAGVHISSKLYPNWVWATFEPQYGPSNPNRCKSNLYSDCNDPWGSNPAVVNNPSTDNTPTTATSKLTDPAKKLLTDAGVNPAFFNYRLTGAQTEYANAGATKPVPLGNSFTEFNAGVLPQQSSCITCHANAVLNAGVRPSQVNPNGSAFPGFPSTGFPVLPAPTPGQWNSLDFSWLLGIMPQASK
jgi:hypothetical protein